MTSGEESMQFCLLFSLTVHNSLYSPSMKLHHGVWPRYLSEWIGGSVSEYTMDSFLLQTSVPFPNFSSAHPCWRLVADNIEVLASLESLLKYQESSEVCRTFFQVRPQDCATSSCHYFNAWLNVSLGWDKRICPLNADDYDI